MNWQCYDWNIKFCISYWNIPAPVELVITQADGHIKMRLASQLISGISRVLQKYFNSTINWTSFVLALAGVFPVISNDSESVKLSCGSSL